MASEKQRIDRFLSEQGVCSRRDCARLLRAGRVTVNGAPVKTGSDKCDPSVDRICVDGRAVAYRKNVYYAMNKPSGVLTATTDKKAKTVLDLLPPDVACRRGLFPAGRLDKDTTGLLLITDDGDFAHRMLAPGKHVEKTYRVTVDKPVPPEAEERFHEGVYIDGGHLTAPATLTRVTPDTILLTITEGKYQQVKLMMKALGCTVVKLHRERIGGYTLPPDLAPGEVVELTPEEAATMLER